jgi:GNAT superfamily N-acetyltransferase
MAVVTDRESVAFSEIESARFGVRVARAHVVSALLPHVLEFCAAERIALLVARCSTTDLASAQAMEAHGFRLMDTLLYYSSDLTRKPIPPTHSLENPSDNGPQVRIRPLQPGDETEVTAIAAAAFQGYRGHYHADPRLDPHQCDAAYRSWAERSCSHEAADQVLVAEIAARTPAQASSAAAGNVAEIAAAKLAGFATLRLNSPDEVEGLLYAVAPESQGQGICPLLMVHSLDWSRRQRAKRMIISTQVTNVSMQKVWCRTGFEPSRSYYTFHKWFTPENKSP